MAVMHRCCARARWEGPYREYMVKEGLSKEVTFTTDQKDKKKERVGQSELSAALTELPTNHLLASPTGITAHLQTLN